MASGQSKSYALFGGTTVTQNDVKQITQYTQMIKSGIPTGQAWQSTMQGCSVAAKQHVLACKNDTVALEELTVAEKSNAIASKAGSVALKGLAIAGNMVAIWAIVTVITKVAQGIDELAHSTEKCKERVEELMSSFNSTLTTANNNAKRVEELSNSYETLSKGVNNLGENVSLTTDEYSEYNSLVNEIAGMFPVLISGYTDEGNAILNLKGNVEQLRGAYKEAQQEAYNMLITSGEDADGNDIIKNWNNLHDTGFFSKMFDFGADDVGGGISTADATKQLKEFQNMTAETYREIARIASAGSHKEIKGLTDIQFDIGHGNYLYKALGITAQSTDEEIADAKRQAQSLVQTYNAEIQSGLNDAETLANAYLMTNDDYSKLSDQSKTAASLIVNNLNEDVLNGLNDGNGVKTKEDVGAYVAKIVSMIKDNPDMNDALVGLFALDSESLNPTQMKEQVDVFINKIVEWMGEDPVELKVRLGFDDTDDLATKYENAIKSAQDKFGTDETKFFTDNSINTPEEIDNWLKIAESANSAAEAEQKYLNLDGGNKPISFESAFNNASFAKSKEKLLELAKAGELTPETISSTAEYSSQLVDTQTSATDACNKIKEMVTATERLTDMGSDLSSLSKVFAEVKDKGYGSADSIGNLDKFKDLKSFNEFTGIVGNANSSAEAKQSAFNKLAAEYLNAEDALGKLDDTNKDYYITQLKSMDIANSEDIVTKRLTDKKNSLAIQEKINAQEKAKGAVLSQFEVEELLSEAGASEQARSYLFNLVAQQKVFNNSKLDVSQKIAELGKLALAYGVNCEILDKYNKLKEYEKRTGAVTGAQLKEPDLKHIQDEIQAAFNQKNPVTFDGGNEVKDKEKKKDTTAFDWIATKIENIKKQIKDAIDEVTDYASHKTKQGSLASAISGLEQSIVVNRNAYNSYMAKANSLGLSGDLQNKIKNGDYSIIDYDSDTADKINKYKEYYQNAQTAADQIKEDARTELDYRKQMAEIDAKKYKNNNSTLEARNSKIEGVIDLSNASGKRVFTSAYRKMIKNSIAEIGNYNAQLNIWQDYSKTLDKTSDAYTTVKDTINGIVASIQKCKQSQAEWNTEIQKIKLTKLQNDLELLQGKNTKMTSKVSRSEDLGLIPSKSLYQGQMKGNDRQIANLNGQNKAYEDMLKSVQKGSALWYEYNKEIQSNDNSIQDLISANDGLAKSLERLPLTKAEKKLEEYGKKVELLQAKYDVTDSYGAKNYNLKQQTLVAKAESKTDTKALKTVKKRINTLWDSKALKSALNSKANKGAKEGEKISLNGVAKGSRAYEAAVKYNAAIDARIKADEKAKKSALEYTKTLQDNTKAKYDNIKAFYADKMSMVTAKTSKAQATIDYLNARGYYGSQISSTYKSVKSSQQNELDIAQTERKKYNLTTLKKQYDAGALSLEAYSEQVAYITQLDTNIIKLKTDIEETQTTIDKIPVERINNSIDRLNAQKDGLASTVSYLKKTGDTLSKSDFTDQIAINDKIYAQYIKQTNILYGLRNEVDEGSKAWNEYQSQIESNEKSMNSLLEENDDLKDSLRDEIYWKSFEKTQGKIDNAKKSLSSLASLIDDEAIFDDKGKLTQMGTAKEGLLSQGLSKAKEDIGLSEQKIRTAKVLYKHFLNGADNGYSEEEYEKDIATYTSSLQDALTETKSYSDQIVELYKNQQQAIIDAINKEIEARKEAIQKKKSYYDYDKQIRTKNRDIQALELQISTLKATEDSYEKRKKLVELEQQLEDSKDELKDTKIEHEVNLVVDGLDTLSDKLQESYDDSIKALSINLQKQAEIINDANKMYITSFSSIQNKLNKILKGYGVDTTGIASINSMAGFATGGVVRKRISANGDSLLASINPNETVLTEEFTKMLPKTVDIMSGLIQTVKVPDYSSIKGLSGTNNVFSKDAINVNFDFTTDTKSYSDFKKMVPDLTSEVSKQLAKNLKTMGY